MHLIEGNHTLGLMDGCTGHVNPYAGYHYHALVSCEPEVAASLKGHAPQVAVAMDGYDIYSIPGDLFNDELDACAVMRLKDWDITTMSMLQALTSLSAVSKRSMDVRLPTLAPNATPLPAAAGRLVADRLQTGCQETAHSAMDHLYKGRPLTERDAVPSDNGRKIRMA